VAGVSLSPVDISLCPLLSASFIIILIFCGPCILIHFRNKNQKDVLFYYQFISIINLYIFRAGLLLIIRRYFSVYTDNNSWWWGTFVYTDNISWWCRFLYIQTILPDDEVLFCIHRQYYLMMRYFSLYTDNTSWWWGTFLYTQTIFPDDEVLFVYTDNTSWWCSFPYIQTSSSWWWGTFLYIRTNTSWWWGVNLFETCRG